MDLSTQMIAQPRLESAWFLKIVFIESINQ